jgi:methylglutamate dehydrogenase subunit C
MSPRRAVTGGRVDRTHSLRFTFDGREYGGFQGDTLASALLANGVLLMGRSFKYHRPRGLLSAGVDEPNALVTVLDGDVREPNIPATILEIHDGLRVVSQNRSPSLDFDVGAVNGLAGKLISAGFYYKTFMGPVFGPLKGTRFWMVCEKFIRRAAGLGRAGHASDFAEYGRMNAFCDVLVVGAGPAGLNAARAAADEGKDVILADLDAAPGGSAKWSDETFEGLPARQWAAEAVAELSALENVRILPRTTVWGHYDGNTMAALERVAEAGPRHAPGKPRHRHWVIRAKSVVLATGAFERPLVFPGNDRPGVMLADAAARFAGEWGVLPGSSIILFTNNDSAYRAAASLRKAGATVAAIVDLRPAIGEAARRLAAKAGGELILGHGVIGTDGRKALRSVRISPVDGAGNPNGSSRAVAADCLLMSGGWTANINLASQAGGKPIWNEALQAFLPGARHDDWTALGACNGEAAFAPIQAQPRGPSATAQMVAEMPSDPVAAKPALDPNPSPVLEIRHPGKAFVDFQHDVTADDIRLAAREGFQAIEHLKRYTTLGMATDQGKTSNIAGMAIMADAAGKTIPETGATRFRPPFTPVSLGALAAERAGDLSPDRLTPMHDWHVAQDARVQGAGLWHRPQIYGQPGESVEQAYVREARNVREAAGIVDVSTLGKIAVQGPDAAEFLDRVYTNTFSTLPVMKARYGLMLREDGIAYDDGTTWRLSPDNFLMTTTTANAAKVMQNLEYFLDAIWPELKVTLTSVTDQWAGAAVAGPRSREILAACVTGTAVDDAALPFMGIVDGAVAGAPVMICRLSFSGELAYEVYCGAGHGLRVWETLMEAGKPFGMTPYGLEALGTLRIEKGHVTGSEIDGRTTARDLHLDWMLSKKKPFIGCAMMNREGLTAADRLQLVGLVSLDRRPLPGGAHLVEKLDEERPRDSIGHVTASTYSPALGRYIALALVRDGKARHGTRAVISDPLRSRFGPVEIVSHHFFDPDGSRMHG